MLMKIHKNVILQNVDLRGEIKALKKEKEKLEKKVMKQENEITKLNNLNDKQTTKIEKNFEKKYKKEIKRLDTLAEDNRRLIAIDRKKDKEIQELKHELGKDQKSA